MDAAATLVTIPFSHYCEKARWALERAGCAFREEGHLPFFSALPARRTAGGRTVPALRAGATALADSTDIVAWADARCPGALLPVDPAARAAALALEDELDRRLGPATRRWAYHHLLPSPEVRARMAAGVPRLEHAAFRAAAPLAAAMLRRALKIDATTAARAATRIDEVFAAVSARLAGGARYLVGDAFSVADLTFAALAAPALAPPEQPYSASAREGYPAEARAQLDRWRGTPAGAHALRLYREERGRVHGRPG